MDVKIYQGNVIEEIKKIEDESIDAVITSPPYWQLRDYHLEDYIWGGGADCSHAFGVPIGISKSGGKSSEMEEYNHNANRFVLKSYVCTKCGAWKGQLGLEPDYNMYINNLMLIMDEIKRVLKKTGTVWINIGDTYGTQSGGTLGKNYQEHTIKNKTNGEYIIKPKNHHKELMLIPHRFVIACSDNGWIIRNDIIWAKSNAMPESVTDRFSKRHEHIFFMVKSKSYYFDLDSIRDDVITVESKKRYMGTYNGTWAKDKDTGMNTKSKDKNREFNPLGKNPGDVSDFWDIKISKNKQKHYASYGGDLIGKPILAGCPENGVVLDPFAGLGTTLLTSMELGRNAIGIEANPEYVKIIKENTKIYKGKNLWGR